MFNILGILLVILCLTIGISMSIYFNCAIHAEIRRRVGIENNRRVVPVTYAVEVDNVPENMDIYVINPEQIITV